MCLTLIIRNFFFRNSNGMILYYFKFISSIFLENLFLYLEGYVRQLNNLILI